MINKLGFKYPENNFKRQFDSGNISRACFRLEQCFPQYIWNDSVNDGKAYTYPQVRTILDGATEGGSRLSDEGDILNQRRSLQALIKMVRQGEFELNKQAFCGLHELAAKEEALSWGVFRMGSVGIAGAKTKPPNADRLNDIFREGVNYIKSIKNPVEQAVVFFLFGAFNQFFYDVNKRTSRLMMNGVLLSNGCDALIIPAKHRQKYNTVMLELYNTKNASLAVKFLLECYHVQHMNTNIETGCD